MRMNEKFNFYPHKKILVSKFNREFIKKNKLVSKYKEMKIMKQFENRKLIALYILFATTLTLIQKIISYNPIKKTVDTNKRYQSQNRINVLGKNEGGLTITEIVNLSLHTSIRKAPINLEVRK